MAPNANQTGLFPEHGIVLVSLRALQRYGDRGLSVKS
jgi:hypothetical protein